MLANYMCTLLMIVNYLLLYVTGIVVSHFGIAWEVLLNRSTAAGSSSRFLLPKRRGHKRSEPPAPLCLGAPYLCASRLSSRVCCQQSVCHHSHTLVAHLHTLQIAYHTHQVQRPHYIITHTFTHTFAHLSSSGNSLSR